MFIYVGGDWGRKWDEKRISAPLLSGIVAAGAVTISDVYAQTNTERLMDVKANTDGLPGMLEALMTAIEEGVASILAAISGLQTHVDDGLHAIDTDLTAIDSDLQAIHTDLTAIDGDLQAIDGKLGSVDADLMELHEDLSDVNAGIAEIDGDVTAVNDNVAGLNEDVQALANTVNALGQAASAITELAAANTATQDGVQANAALINEIKEQLMQVSTAVGVVQETVEKPAEPEKASGVGSKLTSEDKKFSVLVNAFNQNKKDDLTYETTLTFSCKENVFLNMAKVADATDAFAHTDATVAIVITADGLNVYNTEFVASGTATEESVYSAGASFKLKPLPAGESIKIEISTDERTVDLKGDGDTSNRTFTLQDYLGASNRGNVINGEDAGANDLTGDNVTPMTKLEAGKKEVLKMDMSWYSGSDNAGCTLTSPASPTVDYTETNETVSTSLTAMTGQAKTIKQLAGTTFTCTQNTAITKVVLEGLLDGFESFVKLNVITDKTTALKLDVPFTADLSTKPIELGAGTFIVNGTIPANAALITVTYDTVSGGSCSTK